MHNISPIKTSWLNNVLANTVRDNRSVYCVHSLGQAVVDTKGPRIYIDLTSIPHVHVGSMSNQYRAES